MKDLFSEYLKKINTNNDYPLLNLFESTEQDRLWHSEGNVRVHTNMVMNEMVKMRDFVESSESDKKILIYSALFHDYAKPITTKIKNKDGINRVIAPDHEKTAASLLFFANKPSDLTHGEWISVINLVKTHDMLKKAVVSGCYKKDFYNTLNESGSNKLLYILEKADILGRSCIDKNVQMQHVEIFKEFCLEYGLWTSDDIEKEMKDAIKYIISKRKNITEQQAMIIFKKHIRSFIKGDTYHIDEEIAKSYKYFGNKKRSTVSILCGVSGSGKSHIIKKLFTDSTKIISLDEIRGLVSGSDDSQKNNNEVKRIAYEKLKEFLKNGDDCVWDATNIRFDFRKKIIDLCEKYDGVSRILIINNQIGNILKSNKKRKRVVDEKIIFEQINRFQIPFKNESDETIVFLNGNDIKKDFSMDISS